MTCIKQHVDSLSAVLILADPRHRGPAVDIDCTLTALSALLPKTLVNNIAFVFTHIKVPFVFDFFQSTSPGPFTNRPVFLLDNPITHNYSVRRKDKAGERKALEMLVTLLEWLDSLEPQPVTEIACLYEQYQNIEAKTIHILDQRAREVDKRAEIEILMITLKKHFTVSLPPCLHPALESYVCWM